MTTDSTEQPTATSKPNFLKVTREQFDQVLRFGTPEFLATLSTLTSERLTNAERWVNGLRSQKTKETYLVFPVSQAKQQNAGYLYLKAMTSFRTAVRNELAVRGASFFDEVPGAAPAAPVSEAELATV